MKNHESFAEGREAPINRQASPSETRKYIYPYYHEVNITDGSEFLDDAIRMSDQPLGDKTTQQNR